MTKKDYEVLAKTLKGLKSLTIKYTKDTLLFTIMVERVCVDLKKSYPDFNQYTFAKVVFSNGEKI